MNDVTWRDMIVVPYLYPRIPYVYRGDIIEDFALNGYGLLDWTNFTVVGGLNTTENTGLRKSAQPRYPFRLPGAKTCFATCSDASS